MKNKTTDHCFVLKKDNSYLESLSLKGDVLTPYLSKAMLFETAEKAQELNYHNEYKIKEIRLKEL